MLVGKKIKDYWRLKLDPMSPVNKIKAQEERTTVYKKKLRLVTVSHPEFQLMMNIKKTPTFLDLNTFMERY